MLLALCGFAAGLFGLGLPTQLLGSAPREPALTAAPHEVQVVDGETLRLRDRTLRLHGLGAPERGTAARCADAAGGGVFDCGAAAAAALAGLVRDRTVACRVQGRDRAGRALATCEIRPPAAAGEGGAVDLNLALVAGGWAVVAEENAAAATALPALRVAETEARQARRGLWAGGGANLPEGWRGRH